MKKKSHFKITVTFKVGQQFYNIIELLYSALCLQDQFPQEPVAIAATVCFQIPTCSCH